MIQKNPNAASWERYEVYPSFVLGFHGCDRAVGEAVLNGTIAQLEFSRNDYDWLGEGVYFWESSPARALDFARERAQGGRNSRGNITEPFVVGAILNLRHCFLTTEMNALNRLKEAYEQLVEYLEADGTPLPTNGQTLRARRLDCAAFNLMHLLIEESGQTPYDSVRAAFWEGGPLYPNAGFQVADHTQICVRNLDGVLGYFRPL